jgi:hypothetical protein
VLVELGVVEQRTKAVYEVLDGVDVVEVAKRYGVCRQTVHTWLKKYANEGFSALVDKSSKPDSCPHQMSSVEAGGAFSLLVKDRGDLVAELTDVRRFNSEWEKAASVELRAGNTSAIYAYEAHDRVTSGDRESLLDAIYAAWKADVEAGKSSLMIAGDTATVTELNRRARTGRVAEGSVAESGLSIADGQRAGVGDEIVTCQNNRLLTTGKSWVKNGDRFVVAATNPDGSMAVRRNPGGAEVILPADYVAQHVELAYATTSYRSQGRTVDTTHSLVSPTTTREVLYVAATRGRESNMIYVDTSFDPDPATGHDGTISLQSASEVLTGVLANEGAGLSAHETLERAQLRADDFGILAAEYETLARAAQQQRWNDLLDRSGLEPGRLEQVRQSSAYGPLLAALRDAEAHGLDVEQTFPGLVTTRPLDDAEDPAAVLRDRVNRWAQIVGSPRRAGRNLIAGLIPRAVGLTDPDMARGLEEREEAMQRRARALAEQAIERNEIWVRRLGIAPTDPRARERWIEAVTTVVAYRDRWNIDDEHLPLGPKGPARTIDAVNQRDLARAALERASRLSCAAETQRSEPGAAGVGLIATGGPSL